MSARRVTLKAKCLKCFSVYLRSGHQALSWVQQSSNSSAAGHRNMKAKRHKIACVFVQGWKGNYRNKAKLQKRGFFCCMGWFGVQMLNSFSLKSTYQKEKRSIWRVVSASDHESSTIRKLKGPFSLSGEGEGVLKVFYSQNWAEEIFSTHRFSLKHFHLLLQNNKLSSYLVGWIHSY